MKRREFVAGAAIAGSALLGVPEVSNGQTANSTSPLAAAVFVSLGSSGSPLDQYPHYLQLFIVFSDLRQGLQPRPILLDFFSTPRQIIAAIKAEVITNINQTYSVKLNPKDILVFGGPATSTSSDESENE